jgi:hypothetical protein
MLKSELREFIDGVTGSNFLSDESIRKLHEDVLAGGVTSRRDVEALLDLDRKIDAPDAWTAVLTRLVVDFVVWRQAPSGAVSNDDALWLTTVLDMAGPTKSALAIAYGVLDAVGSVDAALLDFIMRGRQQARLVQIAA